MNDREFIELLKAGDRKAFNQLVLAQKDVILNVCYGFVKNEEEAEDLTQEVFMEVYKTVSKFLGRSTLTTWIYRIAVSKSLDALKMKKSKKRAAFFEKRIRSDSADLEIQQTASDIPNPETQLEQLQQQQFIDHCLSKLADTQRIAFVLSRQDGLSYKEISKVMEKSIASVEALIHRAKKNLRMIMTESYKDFF